MRKSKFDKILTKDFLQQEYILNRKTAKEISQQVDCSDTTVSLYLRKLKFKVRTKKGIDNIQYIPEIHKKYYCIESNCNNEIHYYTWKKGQGRCNSCANKGERNSSWTGGLPKCKDCGKQLQNRYAVMCGSCSHLTEKHWNWQGGKSFEPYPLGWTKTYKEQIRYRDGYKCQICGCPEAECNRKLHVHHIDYNKQNINPNNLVSLCQSCHMKTNYNRKYWRNFSWVSV